MYSIESSSPSPNPKKHKKHKKDKDRDRERYYDDSKYSSSGLMPNITSSPGNSRLKLILKVGGSSTPEQCDSPGPPMSQVLNINYDDDSNSRSSYSQIKKEKKKEKKKKKDKKHKKHKEKKRREREEMQFTNSNSNSFSVIPIPMDTMNMERESLSNIGEEMDQIQDIKRPRYAFDNNSESNQMAILPSSGMVETESQDMMEIDGDGCEMEVQLQVPPLTLPVIVKQEEESQPAATVPPPVAPPVKLKSYDKVPLQKMLDHILRLLEKKDPQQFFAWPVTDKIAPGYSSVISNPMDFSTMKSKVDSLTYETLMEFKTDFNLMCNNAMRYNHPETVYYKAAKKLLQSGVKLFDQDRIRSLVPLLPSIRVLHEDQLGFPLFLEQDIHHHHQTDSAAGSQSEEEIFQEPVCLDPTQSIHYVPPHPNDPPDLCGAFTDDLTTEEILQQARLAAREAAHRLAHKKPNSKIGFLRQKEDGSTSLAILAPTNGVLPGTREQPVSLGALTGKLTHGTTQLVGIKEDKRNYARQVKPLNYGAFSSYAPSHDSTFAGLTPDEHELVQATYGDDATVEYADSVIEFAKGCDYAMRMVDEILDTLTKGEHSKTVNLIEERKKLEEEEAALKKQEENYVVKMREELKFIETTMGFPSTPPPSSSQDSEGTEPTESEQQHQLQEPIDIESLKSIKELGIDIGFLDEFKKRNAVSKKLEETAQLLENLEKVQKERLNLGPQALPPYFHQATENEVNLADRVTENLIDLANQAVPGNMASVSALHKAMGIDINAYPYQYNPPKERGVLELNSDVKPKEPDSTTTTPSSILPTTSLDLLETSTQQQVELHEEPSNHENNGTIVGIGKDDMFLGATCTGTEIESSFDSSLEESQAHEIGGSDNRLELESEIPQTDVSQQDSTS